MGSIFFYYWFIKLYIFLCSPSFLSPPLQPLHHINQSELGKWNPNDQKFHYSEFRVSLGYTLRIMRKWEEGREERECARMNHSGATGHLNSWPYCSRDWPLLLFLLPTRKVTELSSFSFLMKTSRKSSFLERIHFDCPSEKPRNSCSSVWG